MNTYDALFEAFTLGPLSLKNRVVMAPMTRNLSPGHVPGPETAEYYRRRAVGGVGLIITEGTCIGHKAANGYPNVPFIHGEQALNGWKQVVQSVHCAGGKIAAQLWHIGGVRRAGIGPDPTVPGYSPSGMEKPGELTGHAMTREDIRDVISAFAQAARDAKDVGFDAVEIHGAHGYLIDQFFWSGTNRRKDEYGGSLTNRGRFAVEVVEAVRSAVGPDYPIIFRWSQWKEQDFSARLVATPEELKTFLLPLSRAGVDIFHCSTARFWEAEFESSDMNLAGWTRVLTGKPTITVGSVALDEQDPANAQDSDIRSVNTKNLSNLAARLASREFDLAAFGRALLANPDLPNSIAQETPAELRPYHKGLLTSLA